MFLRLVQMLSGLAIGLLSFDVLAGTSGTASISYSPANSPSPIPSLSPHAMAALGLLVAVMIFRTMKSKGHGNLLSMLVGLTLISGVAWKTKSTFIEDAFAPPYGFFLSNPQGGTASLSVGPGSTVTVYNQTSNHQIINTITPPTNLGTWSVGTPGSSPQCTLGYTLAPSPAVCYVQFLFTVGPG